MSKVADLICSEMTSLDFVLTRFPMLTQWGVRDEDVFVHSLGCSVWNELGSKLGHMSVVECPAPINLGADIRHDSTWFSLERRVPEVLIEFERFDGTPRGQAKIEEKLCNLIEGAMRWGNAPSVLVLSVWSKGVVSAPDKDQLREKCLNGFKSSSGAFIPALRGTQFLFSRFNFEIDSHGVLLLKQIRCERLM